MHEESIIIFVCACFLVLLAFGLVFFFFFNFFKTFKTYLLSVVLFVCLKTSWCLSVASHVHTYLKLVCRSVYNGSNLVLSVLPISVHVRYDVANLIRASSSLSSSSFSLQLAPTYSKLKSLRASLSSPVCSLKERLWLDGANLVILSEHTVSIVFVCVCTRVCSSLC